MFPNRGGWPFANPPNTQFTINTDSPQSKGLVFWLTTLGVNTTYLRDMSGGGNQVSAVASVTKTYIGQIGGVIDYSASTAAHIIVPHNDRLDITGDLTICAWVKTSSLDQTDAIGVIFSKESTAVPGVLPYLLSVMDISGKLRFIHGSGTGATDLINSNDTIAANNLSHIVAVRDISSTTLTFYINGVQDSAGWQSYTQVPTASSNDLWLGEHQVGNRDWNGIIGEVRIYNRTLSDAEVLEIYRNPWELYRPMVPLPSGITSVTFQYARPNGDISSGSWQASTGSDLYAMLDETTYNDDDYIYSGSNPSSDTCEVSLSSITDPASASNHIISYRMYKTDGGGTTGLTFYLMEGATQRATWTESDISGSVSSGSYTLSEAEANSITDYTDLRIRITANMT